MLMFVLALMGVSWVYRETMVGKVVVLVVAGCLLAVTTHAGSTGGMVWISCLALVLHSVYGLYRRIF